MNEAVQKRAVIFGMSSQVKEILKEFGFPDDIAYWLNRKTGIAIVDRQKGEVQLTFYDGTEVIIRKKSSGGE